MIMIGITVTITSYMLLLLVKMKSYNPLGKAYYYVYTASRCSKITLDLTAGKDRNTLDNSH